MKTSWITIIFQAVFLVMWVIFGTPHWFICSMIFFAATLIIINQDSKK